ncbi:MAG: cellulase family glycosylhydrolase [Mycobacterium sp.]
MAVLLPVRTSFSPRTASDPSPSVLRTSVAVPAPTHVIGVADPNFVGQTTAVQASQLAAMKAIGITSLRIDANWESVQYGGPGTYDWTKLDQAVRLARAAGFSIDLIVDGCPPWAALPGTADDTSPQPASAAQFAGWAAAVAARFGPKGVGIFEIWNEPNSAASWPPAANPAAYTKILVASYAAIKKVDPSALVVSGGLAPETNDGEDISPIDFLKDMYADGAKGSFDALGFLAYCFPALPDTYEPWSAWSQMAQTSPSIRSIMDSNGDAGKSIWITEFGAPTNGPGGVGDEAQAAAVTQAIADVRAAKWIGALYLYTWQDQGNNQDWYGLVTAGGAKKPAYAAVSASTG